MKVRRLLIIVVLMAMAASAAPRTEAQDSFFGKVKRIFTGHKPTPTPTPSPKARKKKGGSQKSTPTPSPTPSATGTASPSLAAESSASPAPTETPATTSPTATPEASAAPTPELGSPAGAEAPTPLPTITVSPGQSSGDEKPQYFEPVRPLSPPPGARTQKTTQSVSEKKPNAPRSTITTAEIAGYDSYPEEVRKILELGLDLTNQNLSYKYNSADPAKGGMDCSGFIQYVLTKSGLKDVPRDARDQYIWARKVDNFQAVLAQRDDSFELDALKPGDLLFWANTSSASRDPEIIQTMIYLGRDNATNTRLMIGASEGGTLKGQKRVGVGVFDFRVGRAKAKKGDELGAAFVGYAHIPGVAAQ